MIVDLVSIKDSQAHSAAHAKKATPRWYQTYEGIPRVGTPTAVIRFVLYLLR